MTDQTDLAVFDPIKALTVKVQEEDAALELDHTTEEGEMRLRSWVRTVRGYRAGLEKIRVAAKAKGLEYGRAVDSKAKELKGPFDTIIDARMKPLDDIEDAKRAKAEAIVEAEQAAKAKAEVDAAADLKRREAKVAEGEAKIKAAEDAANAETAKAEQAEREKRIAAEAAENATKLAESNAAKQAEALKKSIQDNADRQERIRLEEIEDKAAVARMDAEVERKRVADEDHRRKFESDVHKAIWLTLDRPPTSKTTSIHRNAQLAAVNVVDAIKDGNIPHVIINY